MCIRSAAWRGEGVGYRTKPAYISGRCKECDPIAVVCCVPVEAEAGSTIDMNKHVVTGELAVAFQLESTGGDQEIGTAGTDFGGTIDNDAPVEAIVTWGESYIPGGIYI